MNAKTPVRRVGSFPRETVSFEKLFSAMGERLLFQTNHEPLLEIVEEALGRYPQAGRSDEDPLVMQLFVSDTAGRPAPYPPLVCRSHGHLLYLSVGADNTFVTDMQAGYTFGYITKAMAADAAFVRYTFIEAAVQIMLGRARQFVAIHAACVVKDGVSVALAGPSGAGKSTLAYACLVNGYRLLAEDVIQAKMYQDRMAFWGMPWKLHLLPSSLPFFPELQDIPARRQVNDEWKIEIDIEARFPGQAVPNADPGPVVFLSPSRNGVRAAFRRLDLTEAQSRFEVIWSWGDGWQAQYDDVLNAWLSTGAYELQAGETPGETVGSLDALFLDWKGGA